MCLILFAYRMRSDSPLIVAANRDEFYARPTAAAHRWTDAPSVLAGRDLEAGGTWLGVSEFGRFAAVTNFAELPNGTAPAANPPATPQSRGDLCRAFLTSNTRALDHARSIAGSRYQGFSLLLWDGDDLVYTSNRGAAPVALPTGVHALANTHLDGTWPKALRGKAALASVIARPFECSDLIALLGNAAIPPDEELPLRGRDLEFERRVAPIFIAGDDYGTRASTAVIFEANAVQFTEQAFGPEGRRLGRVETVLPFAGR